MYQTLIRHLGTDTEPHALNRSESDRELLFATDAFRLRDMDGDGGEVVTPPKRGVRAPSSLATCASIERRSRKYVSSFHINTEDTQTSDRLGSEPFFSPCDPLKSEDKTTYRLFELVISVPP